jgi:hypothetical protein
MIALALIILVSIASFTLLMRLGFIPEMYRGESLNNPETVALVEEIEQNLFNISPYVQTSN